MLFRKLGNTGLDLGLIGFGTWQIGGKRWEALPHSDCVCLLQKSLDLGINIYDVSPVYGQYIDANGYMQSHAQEYLGEAFCDKRDRVIYCLKLGQFDEYSHRHDYSPRRIIDQFQHSLRRLKTDYIDICLIHAPSIQNIKDGRAINILLTLQALGHVRAIGYSFEAEPEHVKYAVKQPIDVLMLQYNLLDQECSQAIEYARVHGVGVLVGGPFKRGYLTGKYRTIEQLPQQDNYWKWNINLNRGKIEHLLNKVNVLIETYRTPENLRKAALQFVLKETGVASCIVGHRNINEVIENIQSINNAEYNNSKHSLKNSDIYQMKQLNKFPIVQ